MSDDFFDFGFTAVDENELEAVQKAAAKTETVSNNGGRQKNGDRRRQGSLYYY